MKFDIRQSVFSRKVCFDIVDENGIPHYCTEGKSFSFGRRLRVFDAQMRELAYIRQEVWSLLRRFRVYDVGAPVAEIVQKLSFIDAHYKIEGPAWCVAGSCLQYDYEIVDAENRPIVPPKTLGELEKTALRSKYTQRTGRTEDDRCADD